MQAYRAELQKFAHIYRVSQKKSPANFGGYFLSYSSVCKLLLSSKRPKKYLPRRWCKYSNQSVEKHA